MRFFISSTLVVALALASRCTQQNQPTPSSPMNTACPIMGGEVAADGGTTTWKGRTIGFCCEGCLPLWNEMAEEEKAAKLSEAMQGGIGEPEQAATP